jgi:hypothetical protein
LPYTTPKIYKIIIIEAFPKLQFLEMVQLPYFKYISGCGFVNITFMGSGH